jgi:hypothetical protein
MKISKNTARKILFKLDGTPRQNNIAADALRTALTKKQVAKLQGRS